MLDITRTSIMSGVRRTMRLDVTQDEFNAWEWGELIQNAMPRLTQDEREFILTGMVQGEWDDTLDNDYYER